MGIFDKSTERHETKKGLTYIRCQWSHYVSTQTPPKTQTDEQTNERTNGQTPAIEFGVF